MIYNQNYKIIHNKWERAMILLVGLTLLLGLSLVIDIELGISDQEQEHHD